MRNVAQKSEKSIIGAIKINEKEIGDHLNQLVRQSVEDTINWHNLTASNLLPDLCRSAVFGTLCPLRQCTDILEELTGKRKYIVLQALACREKAVRETACALFLQEKFIPENSEASLQGAAIVGATALKCYSSIAQSTSAMLRKSPLSLPSEQTAQELFKQFLFFANTCS